MIVEFFDLVADKAGPFMEVVTFAASITAMSLAAKNTKELQSGRQIQRKLNQAVLRDRIKSLADEYLKRGWVELEELEALTSLYDCYREVGGNSFIVEKMRKVNALEVKDR